MSNKALISYIQQQLRNGYTIMQIRQQLIANGYKEAEVNDAVDHIYHKGGISKNTIVTLVFVVVGIIVVISSVLIFFMPAKGQKKLLDIEIKNIDERVDAGDMLSFNIELINMGTLKGYDVQMKYEMIDVNRNDVVKVKEEAIAIETRASKNVAIEVPYDIDAGQYMVRASALYDDKKATSTASFIVQANDRCYNGIKDSDEEGIDCGGGCDLKCEVEVKTDDDVGEDGETGDEPDEVIEDGEMTVNDIVELAQTDIDGAGRLCEGKTGLEKDHCFSAIARETDRTNICGLISDIDRRDSCYMNIAMNTNRFENCDKIVNLRLKESCELLA